VRFVGVLLMLLGGAVIYELYYKGRTIPEAIANVGALYGLRQLAKPTAGAAPAAGAA